VRRVRENYGSCIFLQAVLLTGLSFCSFRLKWVKTGIKGLRWFPIQKSKSVSSSLPSFFCPAPSKLPLACQFCPCSCREAPALLPCSRSTCVACRCCFAEDLAAARAWQSQSLCLYERSWGRRQTLLLTFLIQAAQNACPHPRQACLEAWGHLSLPACGPGGFHSAKPHPCLCILLKHVESGCELLTKPARPSCELAAPSVFSLAGFRVREQGCKFSCSFLPLVASSGPCETPIAGISHSAGRSGGRGRSGHRAEGFSEPCSLSALGWAVNGAFPISVQPSSGWACYLLPCAWFIRCLIIAAPGHASTTTDHGKLHTALGCLPTSFPSPSWPQLLVCLRGQRGMAQREEANGAVGVAAVWALCPSSIAVAGPPWEPVEGRLLLLLLYIKQLLLITCSAGQQPAQVVA